MEARFEAERTRDHRWRFVLFDLDGTLVQGTVFVWQSLHDHFRTNREERRRAREAFFSGRISYREWFEHDLELLRRAGATRERMAEMFRRTMRVTRGARETIAALRAAGLGVGLLSGSLDLVVEVLLGDVPLDELLINRIFFDQAGNIVGGQPTPFDLEHKATGLRHVAQKHGLEAGQIVFVGDNYNDLAVAEAAGMTVAFLPKSEELVRRADHVIRQEDLTLLLPVLGLPRS